ncbi:hypothetical protein H6P81_012049 [Aristolochia fimbriata]|uniref:Uncharacterized protein n=1 Tax=Aristolochia fimbriata TaxID=158543 RepID=A0AAV7EDT9_ARIFI|nr:hypothetical protein H6P81_012049 [Aristolochia fimbriata]
MAEGIKQKRHHSAETERCVCQRGNLNPSDADSVTCSRRANWQNRKNQEIVGDVKTLDLRKLERLRSEEAKVGKDGSEEELSRCDYQGQGGEFAHSYEAYYRKATLGDWDTWINTAATCSMNYLVFDRLRLENEF